MKRHSSGSQKRVSHASEGKAHSAPSLEEARQRALCSFEKRRFKEEKAAASAGTKAALPAAKAALPLALFTALRTIVGACSGAAVAAVARVGGHGL